MQNLKKLDTNKWRIRFKYQDPLTKTQRIYHETFHGTLQEARARRDEAKAAARSGRLAGPAEESRKRLKDFEPSFLRMRGSREGRHGKPLRRATKEKDLAILTKHILPDMGDWVLAEIRLHHLEELVDYWTTKPYTDRHGKVIPGKAYEPATINTWIRLMTTYLRHCYKVAGLDDCPADDLSKLPVDHKDKVALTAKQAGDLLAYLEAHYPQWHAFVLISLLTGARFAEVSALHWDDVDESKGVIRMEHSQYRGTRRPGNKVGRFVHVPLVPQMAEALRRWRVRMIAEGHPGVASGIVFPSNVDPDEAVQRGYRTASELRRVLARACRDLGLPTITAHRMRNTFISLMLEAGMSLELIQASTAQSVDRTTYHYAHISMDVRADATSALVAKILQEG
jgi:integrase